MNIKQLVNYLKTSLFVYDPTSDNSIYEDPEYIAMKDDYLERVLELALSRVDPRKELEDIGQEDIYPTILLAKKEIYFVLATKSAPLYDLSIAGDAGSSKISRDQRFQHYMDLVKQVTKEFDIFVSTGQGGRALTSRDVVGDVILSSRYFTRRNYDLATRPRVNLKIENIYPKSVEFRWGVSDITRFKESRIYISEIPIVDKYGDRFMVDKELEEVETFTNIHKNTFRIDHLRPETKYYLAVAVEELNGLQDIKEIEFETLA